jgi:hypothetical protein
MSNIGWSLSVYIASRTGSRLYQNQAVDSIDRKKMRREASWMMAKKLARSLS